MSYSRVSIYRRDGSFLTTIQTQTERSWVLNDFGECTFKMPLTDAKSAQSYFEIGNLVFVEHDTLPNWAGKILPDVIWGSDETVTWKAYSGEALLMLRRSVFGQVWTAASPGSLFRMLVDQANRPEDTLIRAGEVYEGGTGAQDTMDGKSIYDHVTGMSESREQDWGVDPVIDPDTNRLTWLAHWYARRGADVAVTLKEGLNFEKRGEPLRQQRWVVNNLMGIGEGSDGSRPRSYFTDAESVSRYGLMQGSEDFAGVSSQGTLDAHTLGRLNELRHPRNTFSLTALNVGETYFALRLGNVLPLKSLTFGFDAQGEIGLETAVRIVAIKYSDASEICALTLDEETE